MSQSHHRLHSKCAGPFALYSMAVKRHTCGHSQQETVLWSFERMDKSEKCCQGVWHSVQVRGNLTCCAWCVSVHICCRADPPPFSTTPATRTPYRKSLTAACAAPYMIFRHTSQHLNHTSPVPQGLAVVKLEYAFHCMQATANERCTLLGAACSKPVN